MFIILYPATGYMLTIVLQSLGRERNLINVNRIIVTIVGKFIKIQFIVGLLRSACN